MARRLASVYTSERIRAGKSAIPSLLELEAMDCAYWRDDFWGDTLNGTYQSTASGANSVAAAINTGVKSGGIRLDPGDANAGRSDLSIGRHLRGDHFAHCWWHITTPSTLASWKFECGLTDVISGTDAGAVNVKATPTFNADDAVVIIRDTDANTTLSLLAVAATVAATPANFSAALVAATEYYVGIELRDGAAKGYLLDATGDLIEATSWVTSAVTATVLLTPWAFTQNRSASQRLLDIDLLYAYQRRTSSS